jgi:4'-phosphopantetheinyl transferase
MPLGLLKETVVEEPCCETWPRLPCLWKSPPSIPKAANDEVHIWRIRLDLPVRQIQNLQQILSPDERMKANRFHFDRHRRRYIASHGSLRIILSKYLGLNPSQLQFSYSPLGKPALTSNENTKRICFNLSHSNEMALCAVTLNRSVGIDLEHIRPNFELESLAKKIFSPKENKMLNFLPVSEKQNLFFNLWTLKEAYLKATGEGIGGLSYIEFLILQEELTCIKKTNGEIQIVGDYSIHQLIPEQGYTAGIAVEERSQYDYYFFQF